jgi:hypothetical protein
VSELTITTQVTTNQGRPDIEIRSVDALFYVEAKVDSPLREGQLEGYLEALKTCPNGSSTSLILLTRYPEPLAEHLVCRVVAHRWFEVAFWIEDLIEAGTIASLVGRFLATQFVDFLKGRGVTMESIGRELIGGVVALRSLMLMLGEAAAGSRVRAKDFKSDLTAIGYYLWLERTNGKGECWVGIKYDQPGSIRFATQELAISPDADEKVGFGSIVKDTYTPSRMHWVHVLDLDFEGLCFFDLSPAEQLQLIEAFLTKCIAVLPMVRLRSTH